MNIGFIPAKTARLSPEREALIDVVTGCRISYRELDRRVVKLANALIDDGLEKGDRVAILAKNCIEYLEIYFACARVGLIAQPMNWRLGIAEITRIIENGEPGMLISSDEYADVAASLEPLVKQTRFFGAESDGSY